MKKFFKCLLVLITILALAVIAFIKLFDFNDYKPQIERLIHKYADLDVKINGDLSVVISLQPTIEINDVVVMLPDGSKAANIHNALVQFSVEPLLHKELDIDLLETSDTEIFYGENESVIIQSLKVDMEGPVAPVVVEFATLVDGVAFEGKGEISSWKALQQNNFNNTDVDAEIRFLGCEMLFKGALKNVWDKMTAEGTYDFVYKNNEIKGMLEMSLNEDVPYVKLNAVSEQIDVTTFKQTANNDYLGFLISQAHAGEYIAGTTIPYDYLQMVNADIALDIKKVILDKDLMIENVISDVAVKDGAFRADIKRFDALKMNISGQVSLSSPKSLPYVKLNVRGATLDLQKLTASPASKKHSSLNLNWLIKEAHAASFMPNTKICYPCLRQANGSVKLNLQRIIVMPEIVLSNIDVNFVLQNGGLKTDINNINAGKGKVNGTIFLDAKNQKATANLKATDVILQDLYTAWGKADNKDMYISKGGRTSALINVKTSGSDSDAYLRNLSGQILLLTGKSVMHVKSLERLQGNIIMQALQALKLNVANKEMRVKCAVLRSDIQNGRMNFPKGIVFDATDLYLVADGYVSLVSEKINLAIQSFSGKISGISISSLLGSLLKIRGTIEQPKLSVNKDSTAKSVIGAIATGGTYNVGDMMLSADHAPCHTALTGTIYADYFKADTSVRSSVSKGYNNTQDKVGSVVKNIKNSTKQLKKSITGLFQ